MTRPDDAVTVSELIEHLEGLDPDAPVAIKASGAYDFLDETGLDTATLKEGGEAAFLNGDKQ